MKIQLKGTKVLTHQMCHSIHYCLMPLWLTECAFGGVDLATKEN